MIKMHLKGIHYLPVTFHTHANLLVNANNRNVAIKFRQNAHRKMLIYEFKLSKPPETVRSALIMSDNSTFNVFRGFSCQLILFLWHTATMFTLCKNSIFCETVPGKLGTKYQG